MKIIDRYLVKQFLQTIFFGILAFTLIFVVIDMIENIDDFIDQDVSMDIVFHYYLVFSPEIIKLMTPVSVLFAALFTAGKMANLSELTAIKASGVSLYRFMTPFLITTFIVCIFSIYFAGYVVPDANQTKINIEMKYLNKGYTFAGSNIFFQDSKTKIVSISFFDASTNQANQVSIQEFDPIDLTKMNSRIDATRIVYDTISGKWVAKNGVERFFSESGQKANYFGTTTLDNLHFTPSDLQSKQQKPEEMDLDGLKELIKNQERAGNDPTRTLIEYYSRFSFPVASLVCVVFGLPISASRRRGGLAVQVGISILVTFMYLVFQKITQAFGKNGALDPLLTAWFANLIFLAAAIINLPRVRQ
ncbi:MAG TPA: LPS export ABC transporter permease LptG [Ignavibacteriaceae bacterium]|nr:LPS export ABC transporter permease LptG [Ignavibacteriaceae bacterium]